MPFYDIMLLYKAYSDYVDEENKKQEEQQAQYEQQADEYKSQMPSASDYKMPDINNISRGIVNQSLSNFSMPKF